jgi:hypothetical protein
MSAGDYINQHILKPIWESLPPIDPEIKAHKPTAIDPMWSGHRFAGVQDPAKLFSHGDIAPAPFQRAGRSKQFQDYEVERVHELIRNAPEGLREVDPRYLLSTQPSVTRPGVNYYMSGEYEKTGKTYADQSHAGNIYPVVYERESERGIEPMLLSGHHRATAALLRGVPLRALVVRGRQGPPRPGSSIQR